MTDDSAMSQSDVVVYGIKQMILDGTLHPGDKLPIEKDLAPRLGVSRSSLREGVRALSIMGVLETRQGAGMYVTSLDASLLTAPMGFVVDLQREAGALNLHAVRRLLETEAAALAATVIDDGQLREAEKVLEQTEIAISRNVVDHEEVLEYDIQFHRLVAHASGNPVLSALIDALATRTVRGRLWRAISVEGAERAMLADHRAVLRALVEHSPDHARLRMATHLVAVEDFLRTASDDPETSEG